MQRQLVTVLGKAIKIAMRVRGGGSALPGLVVERIDPNFIKDTLSKLPYGTVIISGTNGKTTTTKIVVELLENQGLRVFTNKTGSNFTRGVAAALLGSINIKGQLNADIAVLELDEAHATHFVKTIKPKYSLLLNVMRDQLDRFGEIDHTADLLNTVAINTTSSVVLNREDRRIADIAKNLKKQHVSYFGLSQKMLDTFPNDDDLNNSKKPKNISSQPAEVILQDFSDNLATFVVSNKTFRVKLRLNGIYNILNCAAAIALVKEILRGKLDETKLIPSLQKVAPAFGRGEKIIINGDDIELILVKNPAGFRLGLESFNDKNHKTMIAINDNYADGRDMSWLWDVDFANLKDTGVSLVTGIRAYDMALRLRYDDVKIYNIDMNIKRALGKFLKTTKGKPKRIYCTYTAMLTIRRSLAKLTKVEVIK